MTQSKTIREYIASIPPENTATRSAFGLAGFLMAVWASMVPFVKISLDLDEAHLGGLLLCVGLGALVVMPFCGGLVAKRGAKFLLRRALFLIPFTSFLRFSPAPREPPRTWPSPHAAKQPASAQWRC